MTEHRMIFGDSRSLNKVADKSVQLIVTAPPSWQFKDYSESDRIEFSESYEAYINNLNLVWQECNRVLADGCRLCINIGDQFARTAYYGRYKVLPIRAEIIRFCEGLGMDYMGAIIWQKSPMMSTPGSGGSPGSYPYPRNGVLKIDYEYILVFKKLGNPPKPTQAQKDRSALTKEEWNQCFTSHWTFDSYKQLGQTVIFPEELPRRLIRMFSFVGETVLDPFAGSGTTLVAAMKLGRNSIGYEINRDFAPLIRENWGINQLSLVNEDVRFTTEEDTGPAPGRLTNPFRDPHKPEAKKRRFGGKLGRNRVRQEKYFSVSRVIGPDRIELSDGTTVRLLGIRKKLSRDAEAVAYLQDAFREQKIYLRYDKTKYDPEQTLLAYVYLENGTFVNNHLISTGCVEVDTDLDYAFKQRFLSSARE